MVEKVPEEIAQAEVVMKAAIDQSGRRNFVWRCLFMLWPCARDLLTLISHKLGNEICLPGDELSFLGDCIATGFSTFHNGYRLKAKRRFDAGEWDKNVFVLFFAGLFLRAADVQYCQVTANGNTWSIEGPPYLEWRQENPGPLEIIWRNSEQRLTAEQLARQLMEASDGPRTWVSEVLLDTLTSHAAA